MKKDQLCFCGHIRDHHEHYREGLDCSQCKCPSFWRNRSKRFSFWWRLRLRQIIR